MASPAITLAEAGRSLVSCLGSVIVLALASIGSYLYLKLRKGVKGGSKDKPDFTSVRSLGKTLVKDESDDDPPPGGVN